MDNVHLSIVQPQSSEPSAGQDHAQIVNPQTPSTPQPPAPLLPYQPRPLNFSHSFPPPSSSELPEYTGSSFSSLFPSMSSQLMNGGDDNVSPDEDSLFVAQHITSFESPWPMPQYSSNVNTSENALFTLPSSEGQRVMQASPVAEGHTESENMGLLRLRDIFNTAGQSSSTPSAPAQMQTAATVKETAPEDLKAKTKAPPNSRAAPKTSKPAASKATKPRQPAKNSKEARTAQSQTSKAPRIRKTKPKVNSESEIESRLLVPPSTTVDKTPLKWGNLETIINSGSAQDIAQALQATRPLLANLAESINRNMDGDGTSTGMFSEWVARIQKLAQAVDATTSTPRRLVIGVVGRTGTGKSSIINSVLDEGRVLPTNGVRACTAVVTEIAWNPSNNPEERYMAEIDFIQPEAWQKDVERLYEDLKDELDGDGSDGYGDGDDNAQSKIAFDKLRSVFPHHIKGKESILSGDCTVETLLRDAKVNRLIGSTQTVREADAEAFYSKIKEYLDTKVISSSEGGELSGVESSLAKLASPTANTENEEEEMQLWPLIDVVRIYVKADILSTGVVLVDLPGFGDSNLARDAIAEGYLSQCTALWIISPITRVVDDKEARALLDRSLKRQLSLDGTINNLTFVCSKTDDIDVRETIESISRAAHAVNSIYRKISLIGHEVKSESDKISAMQVEEPELVIQLESAEKKLQEMVLKERSVDKTGMEKVKRGAEEAFQGEDDNTAGKRAKIGNGEPTRDDNAGLSLLDEFNQTGQTVERETGCKVNDMVSDTTVDTANEATNTATDNTTDDYGERLQQQTIHRDRLSHKLALLRDRKATIEENKFAKMADMEALNNKVRLVCVQMRNDYSRKRIRQDFAQGQKELDEETTASASGKKKRRRSAKSKRGGGKIQEPLRNYAELANKLPVFCVSSRAYNALRAIKNDDHSSSSSSSSIVSGMQHINETGIPQLQQHVKKMSAEHEVGRGRSVLQGLLKLLASLSAWAGCDGEFGDAVNFFWSGIEVHLTPEQELLLNKSFLELRTSLSEATEKFIGNLVGIMDTKVLAKMNQLVQKSQEEAPKIVAVWARPRSKGGLMWQSYRAICRNKGNKTASKTSRSFTDELISTLLDGLLPTWTAAFNTKVPAALVSYQTQMDKAVERFHREMKQYCEKQTYQVLLQSVRNVRYQLQRAVHTAGKDIEAFRKTAIQQPRVCTCAVMGPIYDSCAKEAGKGCLARMRTSMAEHVGQYKDAMYEEMEKRARNELAFFIVNVIPASLPSKLGGAQQSQPASSQDDGTVHPDVLLSMFFDECRCMVGKADGTVTETMQTAQENVREVLETVADVFSGV